MAKAEMDFALASELAGPFTAIARAMSGQWGIRVIPNGFRCMTDTKDTIWIPFASDHLDEDRRQALHGMLDHEVCHVVEERVHESAGRAGYTAVARSARNKTVRMLLNVVEDIRIEKKWSVTYPGVALNLQACHRRVTIINKREWAKEKRSFWDAFGLAFFNVARGVSAPDELEWLGDKAIKALAECSDELAATDHLEWIQDSYDLADRIWTKLNRDAEETLERAKKPKKEKKKAPESKPEKEKSEPDAGADSGEPEEEGGTGEPSKDDGSGEDESDSKPKGKKGAEESEEDLDGDDDGDDGDLDADADDEEGDVDSDGPGVGDDADDEDEEPSDEDEDEDFGDGDEEDEEDEDEAGDEDFDDGEPEDAAGASAPGGSVESAASEGDGETDPPSAEEVELAEEILGSKATIEDFVKSLADELEDAARSDARKHRLYVPDPTLKKLDRWFKPEGGTLVNYLAAKADVDAQIGAIRAKQLAYVQTITRKKMLSGQDAGMLDAAALASVRTGAMDVFADIQKGVALDTAIEVLLDLSGSMGNGDSPSCAAYYCKRIAIALAEAWEPLRIPNEFIGFSNEHSRRAGTPDPDCVRRAPFDFHVFKAWGERLKVCRERFSLIAGHWDNADGEAVLAAGQRLAMRKEKRKMLVVISDGVPCHAGIPSSVLDKHLRETVKRITRAGIEVLGVGAGTEAPVNFYNAATGAKSLIITDLNTMAPRLFKTLRESILR
jgi:cobalamin biosynthesis protein CobT